MARARHRLLLYAALTAALWAGGGGARAAGIAVIVARSGPRLELDRATLRDIYLKKVFVSARGVAFIPVNLPPDHVLRRAFSRALLHESGDQLQAYWNQRYFHGVRPPYVLGSQTAVVRFVARTPGAVGYVAPCRVDSSVRRILLLPLPAAESRAVDRLCPGTPAGDGS
ncbi:MAG: hypothetical protein P8076_00835 [Gammaproteobacteria bacterium]